MMECSASGLEHQRDAVALQEYAPQWPTGLLLDRDFFGIFKDNVHVLVETENPPFYPRVLHLVDHYLHANLVLETSEDLVDGQGHDLLQPAVAHRHLRRHGSVEIGCDFKKWVY